MKAFLCFFFFLLSGKASAEEVVLGCVDCYSSMSLTDAIFRELFPHKTAKWVLFQSHEYNATQEAYVNAFPKEHVLQRVKLKPLQRGLTNEEAADLAKSYGVRFVFGGMDLGSQRSPILNKLLGIFDNEPHGSNIRLEKSLSAKAAGKYAIPTLRLTNIEDALEWIQNLGNSEIIIKPDVGFFGLDTQFFKTNDLTKLKTKLSELLQTGKLFVIQPRIKGRKFYANTYTYDGVNKVVGAGEYFQIDYLDKPNYFLDGFLDLESDEVAMMQEAVDDLLPSHKIVFGMGHPEFIYDQETKKLYMLEMNGRVGGAGLPAIDARVYGLSQLHLHLLAILDPKRFKEEFRHFPRQRQEYGFMFVVSSPGHGIWNSKGLNAIKTDPSYFIPAPHYEILASSKVEPTDSMDKAQGVFYFVGTRKQIRDGVERALEIFERGDLIDHTQIVNKTGQLMPVTCETSFKHIRLNQGSLIGRMKDASKTIDWAKY